MNFFVKFLRFTFLLALILLPTFFTGATAGVPLLINFQGRLYDENSVLLGGAGTDYCFKFALYDASTAGTKVWPTGSPTPTTLVVRNGVFDAYIGSADALDFNFQTTDTVYVDVEVSDKSGTCDVGEVGESYETLDPRPRVASSGYAINSKTVGGFTPAQSATDSQIPVLTTGGILLSHATTARLASVGTAPLAVDGGTSGALNLNNTSSGDILMGGGSSSTGCTLTNSTGAFACSAGLSGTTLTGSSYTTGGVIFAGSAGLLAEDDANFFWDDSSNELGIGTNAPDRTLEINNASGNNLRLTYNDADGGATNYVDFLTTSGGDLTVTPSGYGITATEAVITGTSGGVPAVLGGIEVGAGTTRSFIRGKYLFSDKATNAGTCSGATITGCEFRIHDITNPASPAAISGYDTGLDINGIFVEGKYAFIATANNGGGNEVSILDISNISAPTLVGGVEYGNDVFGIYVVGKYLYVTGITVAGTCDTTTATGCEFRIYDISNPTSPVFVNGVDRAISVLSPYVVGKYAYITNDVVGGTCSGTTVTGCEFVIYDISNPVSLSAQNGVALAAAPGPIIVSGRYAYIGMTTDAGTCSGVTLTGCELQVYDISTPTAIAAVSGIDTTITVRRIFQAGNYLYFASNAISGTCDTATATGCEFRIYDVSVPGTPTFAGGYDTTLNSPLLSLSGKYAYLGTANNAGGNEILVLDIPGATLATAHIGSIYAEDVQVTNNATIVGILSASGLTAGSRGIYSQGPLSIYSATTSSSLLALDVKNSAGTQLFAITDAGNVGVGTATPAQKLTVADGVILSNFGTSSTPTALGGATPNVDANTVFVSGKYAYVGLDSDSSTANEFQIFDVHNPASIPTAVGGVSLTNGINIYTIYVANNYAYVGTSLDGSGNELRIYDVTNPSSPSLTGSVDVAEDVTSMFVVGRYLYLTKTDNSGTCSGTTLTGCEFSIYDIINPASPAAIGGEDFVDAATHYRGNSVYVQGKYAFIGRDTSTGTCSGTTVTGCEFIIYDISNPFDPSPANGVNVAKEVNSVFASGAYAYIGTDSGSGNEFSIYEVSDASAIGAEVGGLEVGADVNSVTNYGKYVYLGNATVSGNDFRIVDATTVSSPSAVGGADVSIGTNEVFVNGKYLYVALDTVSGNEFRAYDISGIDAPTATIGALAAGSFSVSDNARIDNNLNVGNAINVGVGGINSIGSIVINNDMSADGSTAAIPGIFGNYTFNPTAGGTQVGNRFVINNAPTSSANTSIGQIVRTIDNTALANTVRGIEIVSNAGSNTAGTNTGLRATGATFGVQGITNGLAGGVSLPAALYGESTGTTQGDILRLYTETMTSAPAIAQIYQTSSTFTGAAILIDMAVGSGTFSGNYLDFQNNNAQRFLVTNAGVTSMGLSGTASTTAVCSSLANATAPTAGTAYEIRDCSGAPAADYAEMYPTAEGIEYGDIVVIGTEMVNTYAETNGAVDWNTVKGEITQLVKSSAPFQKSVIGVVSDNYGDFTSAGHNIREVDNPMPVALNGRVPVKISSTSGDIVPGDYLTTSSEPGRGMLATGKGTVIGKALGFWRPDMGTETVMMYVEQGYYDGTSFAGAAEANPGISPESSLAFANFLTEGTEGATLDLTALFTQGLSLGLDVITNSLTATAINVSALDVTDQANFSGLTFFSSDVEFLAGVTFDENVMFKAPPTWSRDTAGFAVIKAGDQSVRVTFEEAYAMTPVVTTSLTFEATDNIDEVTLEDLFSENISSLVKEKDETGFTIVLNKPSSYNLRFSWVALGVADANVFESLGGGLEFLSVEETSSGPVPEAIPELMPENLSVLEPEPEIIIEPIPELTTETQTTAETPPLPEPEIITEPASPVPELEPVLEPTPESAPEPIPAL